LARAPCLTRKPPDCIAAGAEFIVAPGFDVETFARRHALDKPCMPGALTPTEVITAWKAGADMVKIFPCSALGGASYLRALKAPLPQVKMLPTGGVDVTTAADFIKAGAVALGVGAAVVDLKLLAKKAQMPLPSAVGNGSYGPRGPARQGTT
jgi:2-dehydro-3-deoxyphosphogluconate aldolase/(4S)-4-hydroxy-2-oxoglutarate aldolase